MTETAAAESIPAASIGESDRIESLDVLRGFALFGILLVNMIGFGLPDGIYPHDLWPSTIETIAEKLILFFALGKFITLFSFLFGVGFTLQMRRAGVRGTRFLPLYLRRMLVLLVIGVAHLVFVWDGDILHTYAIAGLALLLFRNRSPKTLVMWTAALLIVLALPALLLTGFTVARRANPEALKGIVLDDGAIEEHEQAREALRIYSQGGYRQMVEFRSRDLPWSLLDPDLLYVLSIFLMGLYAGRHIIQNIEGHLSWIRRWRWWALAIGLIANGVVAAVGKVLELSATEVAPNLSSLSSIAGAPALAFFYASTLVLLLQKQLWRTRLIPLAAAGRMALSNYLLQSLICTTIFNSYGFGYYGKTPPSIGLLLTLIIYAIQVPLSRWWLQRFHYGPAEWMWRSVTYGYLQPMRRV